MYSSPGISLYLVVTPSAWYMFSKAYIPYFASCNAASACACACVSLSTTVIFNLAFCLLFVNVNSVLLDIITVPSFSIFWSSNFPVFTVSTISIS